jgi:hypothetical protein
MVCKLTPPLAILAKCISVFHFLSLSLRIHFSIKQQKIKLTRLIIGLLSRIKQVGTKKIIFEAK